MAASSGGSRDATARRRRIMERGSDRLALITGRLQSIPSSSPSPPSDQLPPSDGNTDSSLNTEPVHHDDTVRGVQPSMRECETITEAPTQATLRPDEIQSFPIRLTNETPQISVSNDTEKPESRTHLHKTLNPNQLRHAITSSQDIRTKSSFMVAILALLSQLEFPILGSHIAKNIMLSRPLFLLLLTNMTIVAAHLLKAALDKVELKKDDGSSTDFSDHLGKALDWGMLLVSGTSALFMDCSIYAVVIVCGMSFLQNF